MYEKISDLLNITFNSDNKLAFLKINLWMFDEGNLHILIWDSVKSNTSTVFIKRIT